MKTAFAAAGACESEGGWAEDGRDVVCAAVSAILQSAWYGLTEVAGIEVAASKRKTPREGTLEVSWPETARDDVATRAIVETAVRSVERIADQYPRNVRVIRERSDG